MNAEMRRIAKNEPDVAAIMDHLDVTADIQNQQYLTLAVTFMNKQIWKKQLPITRSQIEYREQMSDSKLESTITNTMRNHLNLVAQMHHAWLDKHFPNSIAEVTMGYDPQKAQKTIHVRFKNGHVAEGPENEAKQDIFLARCTMLYDLPPI